MLEDLRTPDPSHSQRLRLDTLIRLRWLAVTGQSAAVLAVAYWLGFPLPVLPCFALIAGSAGLNIYLSLAYPTTHRLPPLAGLSMLTFDALQLAGLLFLTGGLTNPFALLLTVPVVISATSLPTRATLMLAVLVVALASALAFFHRPLPWFPGFAFAMPFVYVAGMWIAIVSSIAFSSVYVHRVAAEARMLANALTATELVLQREQHISALDGLAAAAAHELGTPLATIALVAREMERSLGRDPRYHDDVTLLRSQSERCRAILKQLTSLSSESEVHMARLPFTSLIEEVVAPHRDFGIALTLEPGTTDGGEPVGRRNPGVIYGLGNLVENAVDFARSQVTIRWRWDAREVGLTLVDDGPGFPAEIIDRIGEPYMSRRSPASGAGGGLGLGLFIAKTLLERSGATVRFRNAGGEGKGARVDVSWPREAFVADPAALHAAGGRETLEIPAGANT